MDDKDYREQIEHTERQLHQSFETITDMHRSLRALTIAHDNLQVRNAELDHEVATLKADLQRQRVNYQRILSSNSWALMRPFRVIRRFLKF